MRGTLPRNAAWLIAITVGLSLLLVSCAAGGSAPGIATSTADANPMATASPTSFATTVSPTAATEATAIPTTGATSTAAPVAATATATAASPKNPAPTSRQITAPTPARRQGENLLAYYVPYDPTSWASFQANADTIDYVAPQWVSVDACGNVGSGDDRTLIAFARSKGVRILPSLLTGNGDLNHRLLTDPATSARLAQQIVAYVVEEGYDGLDLDLEGVLATDRQAYTAFVKRLSTALHEQGKLLSVAIPAKASDVTTGWAGPYEYAAIAPYVDLAMIMTYEYSSPTGRPGSTAPYNWMDRVMGYVASQIPPEKVLMGVAFYGYDWNTTNPGERARALRHPQAAAIAAKFGATINLDPVTRSATFSYTLKRGDVMPADPKLPPLNHDISVRTRPACSVSSPTPAPRPTTSPRPTATPSPQQEHVVWLEDARSVAARIEIASRYGVKGIGTWRLGQEDPAVWQRVAEWRQAGAR
ncbi:MAG: glycosyl hydrolase family 18 protein [Chloroflexi bacterium]|nr:glycosyl hydrolase family 18 protein [Chloroflexota bacterium]MDA8187854.1 glycosyl hydrolase family 18 protein [Dehalococcoidales bacterium]